MVYTSIAGDNSDLIKSVSELYLKKGFKIADVTYGKGVFWKKLDMKKYRFFPSDILTVKKKLRHDFRKLPYKGNQFDVVVLDPPYAHNPGHMMTDKNYRNRETTKGMYHDDILQLYRDGIIDAYRVLKKEGTLWIKCKDEIESGNQRWSHIELCDIATKELNMVVQDLFVLTQNSKPAIQHIQQHARKNHSYLWIFQK